MHQIGVTRNGEAWYGHAAAWVMCKFQRDERIVIASAIEPSGGPWQSLPLTRPRVFPCDTPLDVLLGDVETPIAVLAKLDALFPKPLPNVSYCGKAKAVAKAFPLSKYGA